MNTEDSTDLKMKMKIFNSDEEVQPVYMESCGTECPACNSEDVLVDSNNTDFDGIRDYMRYADPNKAETILVIPGKCLNCGATWEEAYVFCGVMNFKHGPLWDKGEKSD